jgi:regulator of sigma E protease
LTSILTAIAALALLTFVHELGHFAMAKGIGVRVEEFGLGYPPRLLTLGRREGTDYTLNLIPFGAYVRLADQGEPGTLLADKTRAARAAFLLGGPACNLLLSVLLFAICFATGWPVAHDLAVSVNKVIPGSVAQAVGFEDGDLILAADGHEMSNSLDLIVYARAVNGDVRSVTLRRRGRIFSLNLPAGGPWFTKGETRGVQIRDGAGWTQIVSYPWPQAIQQALGRTASTVGYLFSLIVRVVRGVVPVDVVRPVGPVGIAQLTGQAAREAASSGWWFPLLQIMAAFSAALAATNLLPIPGLDGGRVLFILMEALRGKRFDPNRENLVHLAGLILMLMLILIVTYRDIAVPLPFGR